MSIGGCACGGMLKSHGVKLGTAYTCKACGRYEVAPKKTDNLDNFLNYNYNIPQHHELCDTNTNQTNT